MIRHCCAACGRPINRTDSFFEPSDGTLCQRCLAQAALGKECRVTDVRAPLPPGWAILPPLTQHLPR